MLFFADNARLNLSTRMISTLYLSFLLRLFHPFYVSITAIDLKSGSPVIEISSRMFYDDLEKALNAESRAKINLITPANRTVVDSALAAYLRKNLTLHAGGHALPLRYLGYEIEEDVAWCFLESPKPAEEIAKLDVECSLLYEHFDTQSNILHVSVAGKRKSTKLDNPKRKTTIMLP